MHYVGTLENGTVFDSSRDRYVAGSEAMFSQLITPLPETSLSTLRSV